MSVDVLTATMIRVPRDVVAAYAADPDNAPEWYVNIDSVKWQTPPPARVGTRVTFLARFLRRTLEYTYEITELDVGRKLVMRTAEGPFTMETTYTWENTQEGHTRMSLRNRGEPSGFSSFVAPFITMAMRRANRADLAKLKSILEAAGPIIR